MDHHSKIKLKGMGTQLTWLIHKSSFKLSLQLGTRNSRHNYWFEAISALSPYLYIVCVSLLIFYYCWSVGQWRMPAPTGQWIGRNQRVQVACSSKLPGAFDCHWSDGGVASGCWFLAAKLIGRSFKKQKHKLHMGFDWLPISWAVKTQHPEVPAPFCSNRRICFSDLRL